jgi:hypothetical protein
MPYSQSHSLISFVIRNADGEIIETRDDMSRTDAVAFMRSFFRSMDDDEYVIQVNKRLKW